MSRSALRVTLGILLTVIVLAVATAAFCWWKISTLKAKLVHDLENEIGAQIQIASLDFDVWNGQLSAGDISLTNVRPEAPWDKAAISYATVRFSLRDVLAPTLPVSVVVGNWSIVLRPGNPFTSLPASENLPTPAAPEAKADRVQVTSLYGKNGSIEIDLPNQNPVLITGVDFQSASYGTGAWTTDVAALSVTSGSFQATKASVQIRSEPGKITFSNFSLACDQGFLTGDGEVSLDDHGLAAKATLKGTAIPVAMLVSSPWQMKLAGLVSGQLDFTKDEFQPPSAKGKLSLDHAKFNVLPAVSKAVVMVGLPDLTNIEVDQATTDFEWKEETLHLTNLDIRKTDVVRVAGAVDIAPNDQIDGRLKVGLPSSVTAKWPDLQDKVFSVQLEDYNWAEVHVTGTPDHLQEDLTERLVAVGLDSGTSLINQAAKKASDLYNSFMGK